MGRAAGVLARLSREAAEERLDSDAARFFGPAALVVGAFDLGNDFLRAAIDESTWKHAAIAAALEVEPKYFSRMLSGEKPWSLRHLSALPDDVEATLLWFNDYASSRMFRRMLTIEAGRIAPAFVAQDRDWLGRIDGLALVLQGSFTEPIVLRGAAAKPMSAGQVLGDRLEEWFAFEPWNGTSINTLTGGAHMQDLPLPALLAAIAVVAALAYAGLARWKPHFFGPVLGAGVAGLFVIAWLIIDARWQWNLLRQVRATDAQYAGKSWHDRHLAAEDGPLFAFIEKVRAKLPAPPARVFMVADAHYFRERGAYHLYPYNVYFDPWANSMPPPSAVRPGDYLVVYQSRGVQYDPSRQRLRWDGSAPIDAELLLADTGGALFQIR